MRTTIELLDDLLARAKRYAALNRMSLRDFFIGAVRSALAPEKRKTRDPVRPIGNPTAPKMRALKRSQIDEAMFG